MFKKITSGLIVIVTLASCAHINTVPIPTDQWIYDDATKEDAEYRLNVSLEHKKFGNIGLYDFYFKTREITGEFDDCRLWFSGQNNFFCGDGKDSSCLVSYRVETLTQAGVVLDFSKTVSSPKINYEFDHVVLIPFKQAGHFSVVDIKYSWKWTKQNPNQSTHSITASGGSE